RRHTRFSRDWSSDVCSSDLSREADHVEGFAKECAVVTHYRLKNSPDGNGVVVDPAARLEEELIVRPTSETIIWSTYKNWIQSYQIGRASCRQDKTRHVVEIR